MKLPKLGFRLPLSRVAVLHRDGSELLIRHVLEGIEHVVIESDREHLNLSPSVLWHFLGGLAAVEWIFVWRQLRDGRFRSVTQHFYQVYVLALVRAMRPRIVMTGIDNSPTFQFVAQHYREGRCVAVQNGIRLQLDLRRLIPPPPHPASRIMHQDYFCFGQHDVDLYSGAPERYQVERFFPVGSLRVGKFLETTGGASEGEPEADICLISQWTPVAEGDDPLDGMIRSIQTLHAFLARFVDASGSRLVIALRTDSAQERAHFVKLFGESVRMVQNLRERLSSYSTVRTSRVAVTMHSTLGIEALAWGQKVLFCNFSGSRLHDMPAGGAWTLRDADFASFVARLERLLAIPSAEYLEQVGEYSECVMRYRRDRPAHIVLREHVLRYLE